MPKLETQVNQIFLNPAEAKKVSLVLFEERLSPGNHLFLLAELRDVQRKIDHNDLGKLSEAVIAAFRANAKVEGEAMFQASLKAANAALGDLAHKGRKSWLGRFSAIAMLKSGDELLLANSGYTCAWIKRKNTLNELLGQDKPETHPLQIFSNFTKGGLADGDILVLATSSIFNYVSVELFSKMLAADGLNASCAKISDILKGSARQDEAFAVFMLGLAKKSAVALDRAVIALPEADEPAEAPAQKAKRKPARPDSAAQPARPAPLAPIYAPLPEDMSEPEPAPAARPGAARPWQAAGIRGISLPKLSLPSWSLSGARSYLAAIRLPRIKYLQGVTGPGKFFLGSFLVFAVLFGMNLAAYGVRKSQNEFDARFNAAAEGFTNLLSDAESSLLYRNQGQAMRQMSDAETELVKLVQLDAQKAKPFQDKFEEMNNKVNRVTVLRNPTAVFEMPYPVTMVARAGAGYLFSNQNPNSLAVTDGTAVRNLFMLNSTDGDIRGITHFSGVGNMVSSKDKIYLANESSKEFEQILYVSNGDLVGLKFADPNRLYAINRATNQVIRVTATAKAASNPTSLLKGSVDLSQAQDLAVDGEIYVLFPDRVAKYTAAGQPATFQMPALSEPSKGLSRIRVGSQVYLLEPVSNRLLIYGKTGELLNQVHFPDLSELKDMYVDEVQRQMYLLNGNKVYRITF